MEKFPKFIIEDDKLILMKATFHKEIVTDATKVKGGGWFTYLQHTNMFVFSGESHDFGKAKFEDIKQCIENCKVFSDNLLYRNISNKYKFGYDTGTEIIELKIKNGMNLRKFKALINEKGLDDFGASGLTFEVNQLVKDKIYEQADQSHYDEMGRNKKPFFVDDNGCSRDIDNSIKDGVVVEVFE